MPSDADIRRELFRLLGVRDDEDGERILRSIGEHAATMQRLRDEAMREGVKHGIAALFNLFKCLIVGAVFYTMWKMGLISKN